MPGSSTSARQIAALVTASGTTLTSLFGVGPVIAGRILAELGDVARFATKDKFASYNGTAPIDASSGDQFRHRLSRAGNRRINHALHMMAVTQIRYPGTDGAPYYERKRPSARPRRKRCAASSGGCPTRSAGSSSATGRAESKSADHLRPRGGRGLRLPHRRAAHPGRTTIPATPPESGPAFVALDWKDVRLVGIEILDASTRLHPDLLEQAEILGDRLPGPHARPRRTAQHRTPADG